MHDDFQLQQQQYPGMKILITVLLISVALGAVPQDIIPRVPGYPESFHTAVYSGYLDVKNTNRSIHYVFVESAKGSNNSDPVTLWLNGGPGCSSMLGYLQEIGPFYLEDGVKYKRGDNLTLNPYSWHKASNLLFFQSPAGVGYSYNHDKSFVHTDVTTADDNINALLDFFGKYKEYLKNPFWIAGESYAGKYIPDLAVRIDKYNQNAGTEGINFKGIMVGNGVMSFQNGHLAKSQAQYLIDHSFADPDTLPYYYNGCQNDPNSAGCRYFEIRLQEDTDQLNPYNVYGYCYYNDSFDASRTEIPNKPKPKVYQSQQTMLLNILAQARNQSARYNAAPCAYFDGVFDYFNQNEEAYHVKWSGMKWNGPCADNISYVIDLAGSMQAYRTLLARSSVKNYQIVLYNGDWDSVVPYHDTIKGLGELYLYEAKPYEPWFTNRQHSGFSQLYNGILFVTVKGASHQVPQSKRAEAYELFAQILAGHTEGQRREVLQE